jgi:GT2 family glycosyltransferase
MRPPFDVTVVVVNWNSRDLLLDCLESVRRHADGIAAELVVVDNGSSDGSAEAARAAFPEARVVEMGWNAGFARGVNAGLAAAAPARHRLLLNSDARLTPGALRALVGFLDARPDAGIAGALLLHEDGTPQHSAEAAPTLAGELLGKALLRRLLPCRFPDRRRIPEAPAEVETVLGACLLIRDEAVRKVGPLDERFFLFLEETDWCLSVREAGWKVFLVPAARVVHLQGRSNLPVRAAGRIEYHRSLYAFFRKRRGFVSWLLLRAVKPAKIFIECVFDALAVLVTGGSDRRVDRFRVRAALLLWHLAGCPASKGLVREPRVRGEGRTPPPIFGGGRPASD